MKRFIYFSRCSRTSSYLSSLNCLYQWQVLFFPLSLPDTFKPSRSLSLPRSLWHLVFNFHTPSNTKPLRWWHVVCNLHEEAVDEECYNHSTMFVELHCQGMQHRGFIKAKVQVARRTLKMTHKQCSVSLTHSPVCTRSSSLLTGTKQLVMTHHFLLLTWVISLWQHIRLVWEFVGVHSCGSVWLGWDRWQQVLSFGADSSTEGSSFSLISGPLAPPHTVAKVSLKHPRPGENECVNESCCWQNIQ